MNNNKMLRVAGMEFKLTTNNRAFVIFTILGPFLIAAMSILPSFLAMNSSNDSELQIAFRGNPALQSALEPAFAETQFAIADTDTIAGFGDPNDENTLRAALQAETLDAYIILPDDATGSETFRYVTASGTNFQLIGTVEAIVGQVIVSLRLAEAGFEPAEVLSLSRPPSMSVVRLTDDGEQDADIANSLFTALGFTFLLYMTILLYGQSIGTSVLREKSSKTVEIMLSSLSSRDLLLGKILGKCAASLLQYAIWIGMSFVFLRVLSPALGLDIQIAGGSANFVYLVGFFLGAFFLYSSVYAALGAAAEDEQHLSQLAWPVIMFLIIPMVLIGAMTSNPDGSVPRFLSIFPLTSPIVMFQRLMIGSPETWEVIACVGLLVGTIIVVALLGAKIFRVGILMTGKRPSFGEIMRWVRYRG